MKIVVKIGTQSILSADGIPLESVFNSLAEQIINVKNEGHRIILVSSGAVCLGRQVARRILNREYGSSIGEKQLLASIGQHELMNIYSSLFEKYDIAVSQLLLTKQDFETRKKYLNIKRIFEELFLNDGVLPIVNENDSVAIEELMFTDNDELSGLIATQIGADKLIILSNVSGVYDGSPSDKKSQLISVIDPKTGWPEVSTTKSAHGRGGMFSKLNTARNASGVGIMTHIACANHPKVIEEIIHGNQVGTAIIPSEKKSNIKRWIAYNADYSRSSIIINDGLLNILKNKKEMVSILPVGIEKISGEFKKGDIVKIASLSGETVGIGVARYDDKKLNELLGQKNSREFIHCDYMHIF
ncbi:glutamate 5-kinase [Alphaproteobacteria bacterium]|nr:glutamate 5-kinase [Alphaproteobacteria bacterium]